MPAYLSCPAHLGCCPARPRRCGETSHCVCPPPVSCVVPSLSLPQTAFTASLSLSLLYSPHLREPDASLSLAVTTCSFCSLSCPVTLPQQSTVLEICKVIIRHDSKVAQGLRKPSSRRVTDPTWSTGLPEGPSPCTSASCCYLLSHFLLSHSRLQE